MVITCREVCLRKLTFVMYAISQLTFVIPVRICYYRSNTSSSLLTRMVALDYKTGMNAQLSVFLPPETSKVCIVHT
jgi:hypothetical protein